MNRILSTAIAIGMVCIMTCTSSAQERSWPSISSMPSMPSNEPRSGQCQILDRHLDNAYEILLEVVPASDFTGYGESGVLEFGAEWRRVAFFRDFLMADLDLDLDFNSIIFLKSAGLKLPDQLLELSMDAGWTWRYVNGSALQVRVRPGIYSDIEKIDSDAFFLPFSCAGIGAFHPKLSGIAGLELRIGFEREVMPILGLEWEISEWLRLRAGLPESRLTCFFDRYWRSYLGLDWRSDTFSIREKGSFDRDTITIEDFHAYWGLSYSLTDEIQLIGEIGSIFSRGVEFGRQEEESDDSVDIDKQVFLRMGIGGPF